MPTRLRAQRRQGRMHQAAAGIYAMGLALDDRARRVRRFRDSIHLIHHFYIPQIQQHSHHNGQWQRAELHSAERDSSLLRNEFRYSLQAHSYHLHNYPRLSQFMSLHLLLSRTNKDKPHFANI